MSINKVILIGNVGRDPEVRYLEGGIAVAKFSLATSESYTNKSGERITQTEWHNIVLWRRLAEIVEKYVKKGMRLYIEGRIKTRSWEDKEGNRRYTTEIYGDNMQMLSRKTDGAEVASKSTETPETPAARDPEEETNLSNGDNDADDLPF